MKKASARNNTEESQSKSNTANAFLVDHNNPSDSLYSNESAFVGERVRVAVRTRPMMAHEK